MTRVLHVMKPLLLLGLGLGILALCVQEIHHSKAIQSDTSPTLMTMTSVV